jgi:subtilisin family serine protease
MPKACIALLLAALAGCATTPLVAPSELPAAARQDDAQLLVLAVNAQPSSGMSRAGTTPRGYDAGSKYAVSDATRGLLAAISRDYQLTKVSEWPIGVLGMQCAVMRIAANASRAALLVRLQADARVRLAQPLQQFNTQTTGSTDPYVGVQRNLQQMGVVAAHDRSLGQGVRIAVIDTGIDDTHPELAGRIALERNFVDSDLRQFRLDRHGTAIGGIIAANQDNGAGMVGVAPGAQLLALKACWQLNADQSAAQCNSYTLAKALTEAIARRPQIINMSLTGPADPLLQQLAEVATARGIVLVGPATVTSMTPGFPATVPGVLSVQSSKAARRASVLSAPGNEVLTLAPGGHYDFASGDSVAVAAVSGVVALLLSTRADLTSAQLTALLSASTPTEDSVAASINACRALVELLGPGSCKATP